MTLSVELARTGPRIPHPQLAKKKCALEAAADKAALLFGGVAREVHPPRDVLAQVEEVLGQDWRGLSRLRRSELKVVPYLLWGHSPRWRGNEEFVKAYLEAVDARWAGGVRRLWRHYTLNLEPGSALTTIISAWLRERQQHLPELLRTLSERYRLLEPGAAPDALAAAALDGDDLVGDFGHVGLTSELVRTSALGVAILSAAGKLLSLDVKVEQAPRKLTTFLGGKPVNVLSQANCSDAARGTALRNLVDGLVQWHDGLDPKDADPEPVLDFLLALNGDPRFLPERWHGRVAAQSVETVEGWLSRKTIETFFRVIDALKTDRMDMWRERRAFWLSYLPYISQAWLVVGANAISIAEREGMRFARFAAGAQADQCGLMVRIRNTCVLEMNKNGRAVFWNSGAKNLPGLYEESYNRSQYLARADNHEVFALGHHGEWQRRFKDRIHQMTGIFVR